MASVQDRPTTPLQPKSSQIDPLFRQNETQQQQKSMQPVPQTQQQQPQSQHFSPSIPAYEPQTQSPMITDPEVEADAILLCDHPNQWHAQNRIFGRYQTERTLFPFVHARIVEREQVLMERREAREKERAVGKWVLENREGS